MAHMDASLPMACMGAAFFPQGWAAVCRRAWVSGVTSTVMRRVRVKLAPVWVKVQTAGWLADAAVKSPTASPPRRPPAVASLSQGQSFLAWQFAAMPKKTRKRVTSRIIRGALSTNFELYVILTIELLSILRTWSLFDEIGMDAQIVERVSGCAWVDLLIYEHGLLFRGFFFPAHAAVNDGEVVVRGDVVRVDFLQGLELLKSGLVVVFLVVSDAQFATGVARVGEHFNHLLEVGDLAFGVAGAALQQAIV